MAPSFRTLVVLFAFSSTAGCGMLAPQGAAPAPATPGYTVPKESQDLVRKGEIEAYAKADDAADEQLEKLEKDALLAIRVSMGKDKWSEAQPAPLPASQGVAFLRKQKVKLRLEPVATGAAG